MKSKLKNQPLNSVKVQDLMIEHMYTYANGIAEMQIEENWSMHDTFCGSLFAVARMYSKIFEIDEKEIVEYALDFSEQIVESIKNKTEIPKMDLN